MNVLNVERCTRYPRVKLTKSLQRLGPYNPRLLESVYRIRLGFIIVGVARLLVLVELDQSCSRMVESQDQDQHCVLSLSPEFFLVPFPVVQRSCHRFAH